MRSVCFFKRAKSMFSIWLCRTISRAALSGMMPRRACARASAASIARQWPVLASSEKIRRISGVVNMSQKIEESSSVHAELADEEIGTDHAGGAVFRGENLDVRDHPDGAGLRRLRPGVSGAQAIDPVFHAPAVIERYGDLAPGISGPGRSWHPVDAFGRIHRQPFVETKLVEQPRLALDQQPEPVALLRRRDRHLLALPIREVLDQLAVELFGDVIGTDGGIVGGLHLTLTARAGRRASASPSSAASIP